MKRAVHHSAVWLVFPLWLLFIGIVAGRIAILVAGNHDFDRHAKLTTGVVEKKFFIVADVFSQARVYVLIYSYNADHTHGLVRTGVDQKTYERARVGGTIPIAFLPGDPRIHCIDYPWERADMRWEWFDDFVVGMLVFVPGLFLIVYFARRNRIHAQLLAAGNGTWGEVTALKKSHTRDGTHTYLIVHFATPEGREIEGRTRPLAGGHQGHWQVGDAVRIFYDSRKPTTFAVDLTHPLDELVPHEPAPPSHETIWA